MLVTLDDAKTHLNELDEAKNTDVLMKLEAAESIVLDYISASAYWRTVAATWDDATAPALVKASILIQLTELYGPVGRGDDPNGPAQTAGDLSPAITNLLRRYRDPVVV